jgi:hypothetical protein
VATDVTIGSSSSVTVTISDLPAGISADCASCLDVDVAGLTGGWVNVVDNAAVPAGLSFSLTTGSGGTASTCLRISGPCQVRVTYGGNSEVNSDTDTDTFTISKASSTVVVSFSDGGTVEVDGTINVTATVSVTGGGQVPTCTNGCLQFKRGATLATATNVGSGLNVPSSGIVTVGLTTGGSTPHQVGSYTIWAVYDGGTYRNDANDSDSFSVTAHPTTLVATATQPGGAGKAVDLAASITWSGAQSAIDPGTVQFRVNGTNQGTAQSVNNGAASLSVTLAPGTYQITATYSGGGDFAGSSDTTDFQIVVT